MTDSRVPAQRAWTTARLPPERTPLTVTTRTSVHMRNSHTGSGRRAKDLRGGPERRLGGAPAERGRGPGRGHGRASTGPEDTTDRGHRRAPEATTAGPGPGPGAATGTGPGAAGDEGRKRPRMRAGTPSGGTGRLRPGTATEPARKDDGRGLRAPRTGDRSGHERGPGRRPEEAAYRDPKRPRARSDRGHGPEASDALRKNHGRGHRSGHGRGPDGVRKRPRAEVRTLHGPGPRAATHQEPERPRARAGTGSGSRGAGAAEAPRLPHRTRGLLVRPWGKGRSRGGQSDTAAGPWPTSVTGVTERPYSSRQSA